MAEVTPNLLLPYLIAAQAQKHVTLNEALRQIDGILQLAVQGTLAAPPAEPANGQAWIVATGATGPWAGWDGDVALRADGAWLRLAARPGWRAWDAAAGAVAVWQDGAWHAGLRAATPAGALTRDLILDELVETVSGTAVDTTIVIPDRAIVLAVSTRTIAAVTGATSYDCGLDGEPSKFGGALGVAEGSSNVGVIGPTAIYADTAVRLTANGGAFTGGAVRVTVHALAFRAPQE